MNEVLFCMQDLSLLSVTCQYSLECSAVITSSMFICRHVLKHNLIVTTKFLVVCRQIPQGVLLDRELFLVYHWGCCPVAAPTWATRGSCILGGAYYLPWSG